MAANGTAVTTAVVAPRPAALMPAMRNAYTEPFVRPETTYEVAVLFVFVTTAVHVLPPSTDCSTLYPISADPPVFEAAVQLKVTCVLAAVATNDVGALGPAYGTADAAELAVPVPDTLIADTRN